MSTKNSQVCRSITQQTLTGKTITKKIPHHYLFELVHMKKGDQTVQVGRQRCVVCGWINWSVKV